MILTFDITKEFLKHVKEENHRKTGKICWKINEAAFEKLAVINEFLTLDVEELSSYELFSVVCAFKPWRKMLSSWYDFRDKAFAKVARDQGKNKAKKLFDRFMDLDKE